MTQKSSDQILLDAIQGLRTEVARIDRDLGNDRQGMDRISMATVANTEKIDQLSKQLDSFDKRFQDKMADVVEPVREQAENLTQVIEDATAGLPKATRKHWWDKILKGGGK